MQNEKSGITISIPNIQLYVRVCLWYSHKDRVKITLNFRVGAAEQTTSDWLTKPPTMKRLKQLKQKNT